MNKDKKKSIAVVGSKPPTTLITTVIEKKKSKENIIKKNRSIDSTISSVEEIDSFMEHFSTVTGNSAIYDYPELSHKSSIPSNSKRSQLRKKRKKRNR